MPPTLGLITAPSLARAIAQGMRAAEENRVELEQRAERHGVSYYELVAATIVAVLSERVPQE